MVMLFPFDKRRTQESEDYHFTQSMDHLGGLSLRACTFLLHGAAVMDSNFIILACSHIFRLEEQASQWKLPKANPDREQMKQMKQMKLRTFPSSQPGHWLEFLLWPSCSNPGPICMFIPKLSGLLKELTSKLWSFLLLMIKGNGRNWGKWEKPISHSGYRSTPQDDSPGSKWVPVCLMERSWGQSLALF